MKKNKSSLQAALEATAEDVSPSVEKKQVAVKPTFEKKPAKASRVGLVMIGGHFNKKISKQLRLIAIEEDTTNQDLLEEALDLLFIKKGKKKISQL